MKVVHISTVHPTFDVRIFHKECVSLADAGYDTHLIVPHDKEETVSGVKIHPVNRYTKRMERVIKGNKEAFKIAVDIDADVYHLHDPELMPLGLKLKKLGKKVIFDMHELVYHTIINKEWIPYPLRWGVGKAYLYFEKKAFKAFDHFIVVTSQMKENYVGKSYPQQLEKTSIIKNLTIHKMVDEAVPLKKETDDKILVYAGGLTAARGLKEVIQAVQNIDNVKFWLLGPWGSEAYQKECEDADVNNKMVYHGMVKLEMVYQYMKAADIGIAVLHPTKNHLASLPIKSFEYMTCKLPQIMSDFPYWKEYFENCAFFVPYNSIEAIERGIRELLENPKLANEIGERGYEIVKNEYSWESESVKLIDIYKKLDSQ